MSSKGRGRSDDTLVRESVRIPSEVEEAISQLVEDGVYHNKSAAVRDVLDAGLAHKLDWWHHWDGDS